MTRTITIEVNGDATVLVDGTLLGSTPPVMPDLATDADTTLRHDTPEDVAIAIACHEANRQYCRSLGDYSQKPWSETSGMIQASAIDGVRSIRDRVVTRPEDSHERWMAYKKDEGWVYGPQKSEVAKTHPCLVPYDALPPEQQRKDLIFFTLASALLGRRLVLAPE